MNKEYDFIVIGGGSAGYAAARTALEHSEKVAIIDGSEELGGLCILRGCMPSKTLIYAAEIAHLAKNGATFGIDIPSANIDMARLQHRKREIIADFAQYRAEQLQSSKFDLYRNHAKFVGENQIELNNGTQLTGKKIIIASGSVVATPPIPGLTSVTALTSDDVLNLDITPESIIVLGGGVVACELAQFLNRAGSKVIQIQRSPRILKELPPHATAIVEQAFKNEGIELLTDTQITEIKQEKDEIIVAFTSKGKSHTRKAKHLFNALGRKPNTANLNLASANIKIQSGGHIATNAFQQSTNSDVYAAGDCAGPHEIVHIAILQGECAANHAFGKTVSPINYDHITKIVFTDPQIASVGMSEKEANNKGISCIAADYPFDDHGKSILMEAKYGYVKIIAEQKTGKILGAECVGKDAGELIHTFAIPIANQLTVHDALKAHWYHPTLSEIWTYPLEEIQEKLSS